jgi:hypothetical protein
MKIPETNKIMSIAILIGIVVALFIIYKILAATGLIKTSAKKKEIVLGEKSIAQLREDEYFDPKFFMGKKYKSLGYNTSMKYANMLRKALRGIGTDEETIYLVFGKLFNKINISEIAAAYVTTYHSELQADLLNDLSEKDAIPLFKIINSLPNN